MIACHAAAFDRFRASIWHCLRWVAGTDPGRRCAMPHADGVSRIGLEALANCRAFDWISLRMRVGWSVDDSIRCAKLLA